LCAHPRECPASDLKFSLASFVYLLHSRGVRTAFATRETASARRDPVRTVRRPQTGNPCACEGKHVCRRDRMCDSRRATPAIAAGRSPPRSPWAIGWYEDRLSQRRHPSPRRCYSRTSASAGRLDLPRDLLAVRERLCVARILPQGARVRNRAHPLRVGRVYLLLVG